MTNVPRWTLGVLRIDGAIGRFRNACATVRDELLTSGLSPRQRDALTIWAYERSQKYRAGDRFFESGLFEWEDAIFAHPRFPSQGRILLGGSGGGRELRVLEHRGYEVVAFEPCAVLAQAAARVSGKTVVLVAAYEDLVEAVTNRLGPLRPLVEQRFDAVVLGWGSFSHVHPERRHEVLAAVRALAPGAVVVVSYLLIDPRIETGPWSLRISRTIRWFTRRAPDLDASFSVSTGFVYRLRPGELRALADATGYGITLSSESEYGYALLQPQRADRATRSDP